MCVCVCVVLPLVCVCVVLPCVCVCEVMDLDWPWDTHTQDELNSCQYSPTSRVFLLRVCMCVCVCVLLDQE